MIPYKPDLHSKDFATADATSASLFLSGKEAMTGSPSNFEAFIDTHQTMNLGDE